MAEVLYVQTEGFIWSLLGFLEIYQQTLQLEVTFKLLAIQWCSVSTVSSNWEVNTAMENDGLNEVNTVGLFPTPKVR